MTAMTFPMDRRGRHSGLTPHEQAIMSEWDGGRLGMTAIARKLGLGVRRVEATISCYDGHADHRMYRQDCERGSANLLAAIGQHHPQRIRA